jgi:cytosine/adenosine deaminase-related metal-dependent hydrolase
MTPRPYLPSALVYQTRGTEVDTVVCNGEVVVDGDRTPGVDGLYDDLTARAREASESVVERAGMESLAARSWTSIDG